MEELVIVLLFQISRFSFPKRIRVVYDSVLLFLHTFRLAVLILFCLAVFPHAFLAETNGNRHELAVLVQKLQNSMLLQELARSLVDVHYDFRTPVCLVALFYVVFRAAVASPMNRRHIFIRFRSYLNQVGHHKSGEKAQSEMTNQAVSLQFALTFVFFDELFGTGESNLSYVLLHLFLAHADTAVDYRKRLRLLVNLHIYRTISELSFELSQSSQSLQLLCSIDCVGDNLP